MLEVGRDSAELQLFIGKSFYARGDDEHAIAEYRKALARNPKLPFAYYQLGLAYRRRNDIERARAEFIEDTRVEPDVAYNYEQLGAIAVRLDRIGEAEHYYRQALRLDLRIAAAQFGLAKIYREQGRLKEALAAADAARRLDPDSASVRYVRAQVLRAPRAHRRGQGRVCRIDPAAASGSGPVGKAGQRKRGRSATEPVMRAVRRGADTPERSAERNALSGNGSGHRHVR
jgi:tetratricopeptide (TPR) repeat protein